MLLNRSRKEPRTQQGQTGSSELPGLKLFHGAEPVPNALSDGVFVAMDATAVSAHVAPLTYTPLRTLIKVTFLISSWVLYKQK